MIPETRDAVDAVHPAVHPDVDPAVRREQLRRAIVASAVGSAIEWYDFYLYGLAAALVFPARFFPTSDPFTGTLLAFSTYFVGFASRPLGAVIFGYYGDRIGRKTSLIATLVLMGIATAGIGLVPDYSQIGIWGAVLLTFGRVLQGIGVGGEWGGSVLLAAEWSERKHRGFVASWPHFGAPAGLVLANSALGLMSLRMNEADFLSYGWRLPFLASVVLIGIGFYIRVGILETPAFQRLRALGKLPKTPVRDVVRNHLGLVAIAAFLRTSQQTSFYLFTVYILTYGTQVLKFTRGTLLLYVTAAATIAMFTVPFFGWLSDRIGRRRLTAIGAAIMLVYPFVYFQLLDTGSASLIFLAILLSLPIHDIQYGPQAALIAESFPTRIRYTGSSLGYQLASIVGSPGTELEFAL